MRKKIKLSELYCYKFIFKNNGNSGINRLIFSTNLPETTTIYNLKKETNSIFDLFKDNTYVSSYNFVSKGDELILCVCYLSENKVIYSNLGSPALFFAFQDTNGYYWEQTLNILNFELSYPFKISKEDFQGFEHFHKNW